MDKDTVGVMYPSDTRASSETWAALVLLVWDVRPTQTWGTCQLLHVYNITLIRDYSLSQ